MASAQAGAQPLASDRFTMRAMARQAIAAAGPRPLNVSLVALPDAVVSTLAGLFDVLNGIRLMNLGPADGPPPFRVEIVGEVASPLLLASGVHFEVQGAIDDVEASDIVIVPSVLLRSEGWCRGRYPRTVAWLQRMHERGAMLCSACSGIFLLAETGLFDGRDATVHFGYARAFAALYPQVTIHPERVLVISGLREELVCSGASTTWHDLALYLIARHAGATIAQETARSFALQWLAKHFSVARPVEEVIKRSRLAERTFKRRFASATGLAPIDYVQRLRVEDAKRRLERTDAPIDEISWRVGYEDPAFFRRLFKRTTNMAPGAYRRRFRIAEFARP
jgi:transcriptional regulator GlxA family with amidase domain